MRAAQMVSDEGRALKAGQFRAFCANGHDRLEFGDRDAFQAHVAETHKGGRKLRPGGADDTTNNRTAPGWKNGKIEAPYKPGAPRPTPGGLEKVMRDMAAGKYDMPLTYTGPTQRMGEVA